MGSQKTRASIAAMLVAGAALVQACDGGSPPQQSGTQLLPGRDFGNLFFWNAQTAAFTRQTTAPGGANQDLWVWPDEESAPLVALTQVDWSPPVSSFATIVGDILMTGPNGVRIYDLQARTAVDLESVGARGAPTGTALGFAAIRRDGGSILGRLQMGGLFVGRGATFSFLVPPYIAWGADFLGTDLAVVASPSVDELDSNLVYRMAVPSGEVTPLPVPPLGATPLGCSSFQTSPCTQFRVVGCGAGDPVCAETGRAPCAIFYTRTDPTTMATHPFVFDVAAAQEQALPGDGPSGFVVSPDRRSVAWMHSDFDDQNSGTTPPAETAIYVRNLCSGAAVQCSLPRPQQIAWRSDGGALAVDLAEDQLGLVDVPTGSCNVVGQGTVYAGTNLHAFSPPGDRLAWITMDRVADPPLSMLWVGDAAGGGPREVASGLLTFSFSPDGQAIFVFRANGDQISLGRVSLENGSPDEQMLADASNGAVTRGNRRVLLIDHWNGQDASGNLDLIDVSSGAHQVLAHAVTDFAVDSTVDGAARVIYAVRGRFTSGQDGLWNTTLPAP